MSLEKPNWHFQLPPNWSASPLSKTYLLKVAVSYYSRFGNTIDLSGDVGKPNISSLQLKQNVVDKCGAAPVLRLGGNTQDKTVFCEDCPDTLHSFIELDPNKLLSSEAVNAIINKPFFQVRGENVPPETHSIFGLGFAFSKY